MRLSFGTRQRTVPAQRFQIIQQIAGFLRGPIRRAIEQPGKRRHDRIRHQGARRIKMRQLPVRRAHGRFAREVGPDAARAPQLRIIEDRLPGERRPAEARHVTRDVADLLGVAIGAAFARVDLAPARFAGRQAAEDAAARSGESAVRAHGPATRRAAGSTCTKKPTPRDGQPPGRTCAGGGSHDLRRQARRDFLNRVQADLFLNRRRPAPRSPVTSPAEQKHESGGDRQNSERANQPVGTRGAHRFHPRRRRLPEPRFHQSGDREIGNHDHDARQSAASRTTPARCAL